MCKCELFTSTDSRSRIVKEIKSFKDQEFIYAALPYGAFSFMPDPQRMIVEDAERADLNRLTKFKTNSRSHNKFLIGSNKVLWGSGNLTETSIYDKHETYEVVYRECHQEKYDHIFSEFKWLWNRSNSLADREVKP